ETPKAIQQSIEGVDKVAEIVRAMKEFSHPGSDKKQSIDLNRAIESTLTVSRSEWKYAGEVVTKFDPDLPLVPCFPNEFNQVILNLIVNAAQAILEGADESSTPQGTITISTTHENDWVEVRIQDTGTGIPEEIRSKVFDHFFTTKGVGKGTGQGLAIAYSIIVEKHGGTINFESEVGEGTTFIVRLPLAMDVVLGGGVEQEEEESACLSQ
ncbi:MAG: HAMP domain-containing sensor histidine kinase, partial [Planctomycetia bacterium]